MVPPRPVRQGLVWLISLPLLALFAGCVPAQAGPGADAGDHPDRQSAFRIRSDFAADLDADTGWAAATNRAASVRADQPFRLRLELEHAGAERARRYRLQVRRNGGNWQPLGAENFPQPAKELALDFEQRPEGAMGTRWQMIHGPETAPSWRPAGDEGYLRFQAGKAPALALARYSTPWTPVEFAADLRLPAGKARRAGLVFGYEDEANYHRVELSAGRGVRLVRVRDGEAITLAGETFDVPTERWAELKIVLRGREVTVEYDDEALVFSKLLNAAVTPRAGVFMKAGGRLDVSAIVIEGMPRTPRASIMAASVFEHGDITRDLLAASDQPFVGGAGVSFDEWTPSRSVAAGQTEWEFPIVIRRFSDNAARNDTGDRFEFRVVDESGRILPATDTTAVTLDVPAGHLGGTFVETPMRIGPWQADNGDLYFLMEPAETDNLLMTVKSADGGRSWVAVDGGNRPATGDLEGFASTLVGNRIHMLHQTSDHVFYHVFRTADHPEQPDTWAIRDERLASPAEPPTQVTDIAVRSDGSVVAVYGGPEKIHYRIRSPGGGWDEESVIDADRGPRLSGPALVKAPDDVIHLSYTGDDGTAWYRQLRPDGELTRRRQLASGLGTGSEDVGSVLPLVYLPASDSVSVIYRLDDGHLWERRVDADGDLAGPVQVTSRPVVQNAVDADQTGADAIGRGDSVHVLFIEADTGHLFHTRRDREGGWREAERIIDNATVQWVRGALVETDSGPVYGYVYDAGSDGGSGMNRYGETGLGDD